jgi:hypothetical protein
VQCEVLGITICSHRDLEELLKGFNQAYNRRRQRVLKGASPEQVVRRRLAALQAARSRCFAPCPLSGRSRQGGLTSRQSVSLYAGWYKLIKFRKAQLDAGGG